jgi:sirohydrochlorin ferrochelatase
VVTPYFLTMGIHLQRDLPKIAGAAAARHPGIEIVCTEPLDGHPALETILAERALGALKK